MGMFDKLLGGREISLTPQAALLLAAISMVAADGDVDEDEMNVIRRLDGSGRTDAWELAVKAWKQLSLDECIERVVAVLRGEQRLAAVANLLDIAMADGFLAGPEKLLLERYVEALGVTDADVRPMVDVIALKNRREVFLR